MSSRFFYNVAAALRNPIMNIWMFAQLIGLPFSSFLPFFLCPYIYLLMSFTLRLFWLINFSLRHLISEYVVCVCVSEAVFHWIQICIQKKKETKEKNKKKEEEASSFVGYLFRVFFSYRYQSQKARLAFFFWSIESCNIGKKTKHDR